MNEYPRGERPEIIHIDSLGFIEDESAKAKSVECQLGTDTDDCQPGADDYYGGDDDPKRFGNNRKHVKKSVAKAKRKMAKKSKQRNRK